MGGGEDAIAKPSEKRRLALAAGFFGIDSGAALATMVGVLVEVPIMLSVVAIVMRSKAWYRRA